MSLRLEPYRKPIHIKARSYSPENCALMEKYADRLLEMDFSLAMPTATRQTAPLLIPKPGPKAMFRTVIDSRSVNAVTVKESWPMPNLEAELSYFEGIQCFASLDFEYAY